MLLRNDTPLAAICFDDLHRDGAVMAVVAVRASYALTAEGALRLSERQAIALSDVYEGDPHRTPLLRANDLVGYRPHADVTVLGSAHARAGRPQASWDVSLGLGNARTDLRVHGPRRWEPDGSSWRLGPAEPAVQAAGSAGPREGCRRASAVCQVIDLTLPFWSKVFRLQSTR